ncbi:MAG: hypothetical protein E3J37_09110 [Anaerolineales bacterium]|nr:MAG: hypothetical protein E3J37_09110 [Anaerolineales bacterium]
MPFLCPKCSTPQSLEIKAKIELPPDSRSDEITLQIVECSRCRFAGIAIYEESRRGTLGSESFSHIGYRVSVKDLRTLKRMIKQCPKPNNWRCGCSAHRTLGVKDAKGRWNGLKEIERKERFELNL